MIFFSKIDFGLETAKINSEIAFAEINSNYKYLDWIQTKAEATANIDW